MLSLAKLFMLCLVAAICTTTLHGASRTWTSRNGSTLEATLVKEEAGVVTLQRSNGSTFQIRLNALSDADIRFIKNQAAAPATPDTQPATADTDTANATTISVTLSRDNQGQWQLQQAPNATEHDKVIFQLNTAAAEQPPLLRGDTSWQVISVNSLGKQLKGHPVDDETPPADLITDGKFIFVIFSVKNDARGPITIPSPWLIDHMGRTFSQAAKQSAHFYIPQGLSMPDKDMLQPGFEKQFCAFFEIPPDAHPAALEVFPAVLSAQLKRSPASWATDEAPPQGKRIALGEFAEAVARGLPQAARLISGASPEDDPAETREVVIGTLFMSCKRAGAASVVTTNPHTRDRTKTLSYSVNLRLGQGDPLDLILRGFFIGDSPSGREMVMDLQELDIELQPGRAATVTITSEPIIERRNSGVNLKGVIIQAWSGTTIVSSWASNAQWRRLTDSPDIIKEIGYYAPATATAPATAAPAAQRGRQQR